MTSRDIVNGKTATDGRPEFFPEFFVAYFLIRVGTVVENQQ